MKARLRKKLLQKRHMKKNITARLRILAISRAILGNGDQEKGALLLYEICQRLVHARTKHPHFADDPWDACTVITDELDELYTAVEENEGPERVKDETLDVAVTALRLYLGEWGQSGKA